MLRKIIEINGDKCIGCGLCAEACHEGAIGMVNGKARLLRDDYCDGLGDCLPACPTGAITFIEREAAAYDEAAVQAAKKEDTAQLPCGCPGSAAKTFTRDCSASAETAQKQESALRQWPVQIKLVSVNAPWFTNADLLIAADCTAYAYAGFHQDFIQGHITLIGCPKLDSVDYSEKLTQILRNSKLRSITVVRMEVPCCGGIEFAVENAIQSSGVSIPRTVVILSTEGKVLEQKTVL